WANTVIQLSPTTEIGGVAEGVLGVEYSGGVTLVQGWNWYTGSNAATVGAGQYEFETIVMHELGHSLGLGHSTEENSVMYATLATGQARRQLSTADLAIPDVCSGPCGLHVDGWGGSGPGHPPSCGCPACAGRAGASALAGGLTTV